LFAHPFSHPSSSPTFTEHYDARRCSPNCPSRPFSKEALYVDGRKSLGKSRLLSRDSLDSLLDASILRQVAQPSFSNSSQIEGHVTKAFPKAITNAELVSKVTKELGAHGYGSNSLLACSLCCDEVNRVLEKDFSKHYTDNFNMGGLAGFPFGGVTSFGGRY
jgi:hypothetical protein